MEYEGSLKNSFYKDTGLKTDDVRDWEYFGKFCQHSREYKIDFWHFDMEKRNMAFSAFHFYLSPLLDQIAVIKTLKANSLQPWQPFLTGILKIIKLTFHNS